VLATFAALFAFLGLAVLAYRSPNYLDDTKVLPKAEPTDEQRPDPATRLNELRAKNQAVLDGKPGTGTKMSAAEAADKLLATLKSEKDHLPFPTPEPPPPVIPKAEPKGKK
jgi:hypothetical protein